MLNKSITPRIQSVTELTSTIRGLLETELPFVSVAGEISNLRIPSSGHIYFTLKDASSQIRAVMFRHQQKYMRSMPDNGQEVLCRGRISVYEARGEYQIIIDMIEPLGVGRLMASFEKLKQKLAEEGLFDDYHKQPLPFFPQNITLITSTKGAAVHDFITTLNNRHPGCEIDVFPVRVQGEGAAEEISEALSLVNKHRETDVIVLCRGGGSLEDLWAFNEEVLARAVFSSKIPVISAVGHETDYTISDFVADYRAATPTAAAEAVIPAKAQLKSRLLLAFQSIGRSLTRDLDNLEYQVYSLKKHLGDPSLTLDNYTLKLDNVSSGMCHAIEERLMDSRLMLQDLSEKLLNQSPVNYLRLSTQRISEIKNRLRFAIQYMLDRKEQSFRQTAATLDAVSPLAVLGRGYSITKKVVSDEVVKESISLKKGDEIETILHRGRVLSKVTQTSTS